MRHKLLTYASIVAMLATTFAPSFAYAADTSTSFGSDTQIVVGAATLTIKAGSTFTSKSVDNGTLTVTVPDGAAFELRTTDTPFQLENNALLPACSIQQDKSNRLFVAGPKTFTVTPSATACSTSGYSTSTTPGFTVNAPSASVSSGDNVQLFWTTTGRTVSTVSLQLSTDDGETYPTTVADKIANNGFLMWTVPQVYTTSDARLRIQGWTQNGLVAQAVSPSFSIEGMTPPVSGGSISVTPYDYEPQTETFAAATIGVDKGLVARTLPKGTITCVPDTRIKATGSDAVYYCGIDGKRYVFPNLKTYDTWYNGFAGVVELTPAELAQIPLGGNVTYRPGVRLVKVQSSPEVFAVGANGELRYVSQAAATRMYGKDWNTKVDDIPDAFFTNYHVGPPIMQ